MSTDSHGSPAVDLNGFRSRIERAKIETCHVRLGGRDLVAYARSGKSANALHRINSITKSVLSLLIGIALDRGDLDALQTPVGAYLEGVPEDKRQLTLAHLITMTDGLDWPEWGDWNGQPTPMYDSPDWVAFVLGRPVKAPPGTAMAYNSGSSQLLSAVLQQATGMTTEAYAARHLFGPLGIEDWLWHADAQGVVIGGFGLSLRGRDLFKLGLLMLNEGRWEGRQIVPAAWARQATRPQHHTYDHVGSYGYHWWIYTGGTPSPVSPATFFAMGYGGQYVFVMPERKLVVSFTSNLYRQTFMPLNLFAETFLPGSNRQPVSR
ncbi:serine hydrolase domain-containing protein [Cohnella nanjingensis]|uniref:Serine hydrolase n=1 Tax=Cohnella nanjingensis TaxID=1387779 RepID=A0A7X0VCT2_9BACL|nr:serine hydrolase [Cohnella nanjingensis]MBB6669220.1 serine hydrolase [Cohnella nanjingensis]